MFGSKVFLHTGYFEQLTKIVHNAGFYDLVPMSDMWTLQFVPLWEALCYAAFCLEYLVYGGAFHAY